MAENELDDLDLLKRMETAGVLVAGDIMLDRFVYGHVDRISPESPIPVLSIDRENAMLGGAGNTLSNIIHLKCKGKILSVTGADENGKELKELAESLGIDTEGLIMVEDRPTTVKTRFLAGHQQLLRTDFERIVDVSEETAKTLLERASKLLDEVGALVLSDYGKGMLTWDLAQSLIKLANEKHVPVLVDPKGTNYRKYAGADVVTPNKKELSEATGGTSVSTDEDVTKAAEKLIKECDIKTVVATRSKDGMSIVNDLGPIHIRSASDIEVFDVSGAGDTVIATIASSLAAGADIVQAAALANLAGSIVVSKVGTAPIRADELKNALEHHEGGASALIAGASGRPSAERMREAPVLSWDEAKEDIERWRARGLTVGFTNGCFDIVHLGHVSYLNAARGKCDRLVVGLNSDSSVKILKGEDRPVHNEESRAAVMAALGAVDLVVLFGAKEKGDDNTACVLIEKLQPDIYFKGGDYTVDEIPETPSVISYGGKVEVLDVFEGHSTTSSIKKILGDKAA